MKGKEDWRGTFSGAPSDLQEADAERPKLLSHCLAIKAYIGKAGL
jgi:hypothetical protein